MTSRRHRTCTRCNGYGHNHRECTSPDPNQVLWCTTCGETRHSSSRCTNTTLRVSCRMCGGVGHELSVDKCGNLCSAGECVHGLHDRDWCPKAECRVCGGNWHIDENCTNFARTYCHYCGQTGHKVPACTSIEGTTGCSNCGGVGHNHGVYSHVPCPVRQSTIPVCPRCNNVRHLPRDCPVGANDPDDPYAAYRLQGRTDVCANCRQTGHSQNSCPRLNQ